MAQKKSSTKTKTEKSKPTVSVIDFNKLPPQNVEAERSLLGCLLIDKEAIYKVVDILKPEDFYREDHAKIYRAMLVLYENKTPIDLVTLSDQLKKEKRLDDVGGATYLANLANSVDTAAHVVHYANIIAQKAVLRRLISASQEIALLGYEEAGNVDEILDKAESLIFDVSHKYFKHEFVDLKDILAESFERIDEIHKSKGKLRGIPTGFKDLDNILGGLQPADLIVIASRPAMGKTSLALAIALYVGVKEKIPVGIFSLEMSKEQLVDRLLCAQAGVDSWKLRTGNLSDEDFPKIGYAMGVLSEAPIYIDDSPLLNVLELRTKARRLQAEKGLGLLIIDYLQLLQGAESKREGSRVQEISEISRALKSLARELNIPVVALSQLSRAVEMRQPKIPQLADLRESGCLTGDTLILRADTGEQVPIKKLVGKKNVWCFALDENLKLKKAKFKKIFPTGKKLVFELKTASGRKITASANHPFLTLWGWRRLDELKPGDRIAVPRRIPAISKTKKLSKEKIILLAHLIGDGSYLARHALQYTNTQKANLAVVASSATKAFGVTPRLVKERNWHQLYLSAPYHLTHNVRNPIVKWLDEDLKIFNQRSFEKEIPQIIFSQPRLKIALFLKHLWSTDGSVAFVKKGKKFGWRIYYSTTSQKLAYQIQHLLLRLGILSTVNSVQKENFKPNWQVEIMGKENQARFLKKIGVFGQERKVKVALKFLEKIESNPNRDTVPKELWQYIAQVKEKFGLSWREFVKKYGMSYCGSALFKSDLSRKRLKKITQFLPDESLKNLANSDIFWDEIVEIKEKGVEKVYDATVPKYHNFIANDFIVENSIEQDADVVMFIYREDYYEKDTERKNIADILIRKHRNGPTGDVELYFMPEQLTFKDLEKKRSK